MVCEASHVLNARSLSIDLNGFPVLLARSGDHIFAFVNACPHQFLPLDYRRGSVVSADGKALLCSNHQAGFDLESGEGVSGFGIGCALDPVPVRVNTEGMVVIDDG